MDTQHMNLDEILQSSAGQVGFQTIEVTEQDYTDLLNDANQAGLVLLEAEDEFSLRQEQLTIKIRRTHLKC
jgi:hypothetical protein